MTQVGLDFLAAALGLWRGRRHLAFVVDPAKKRHELDRPRPAGRPGRDRDGGARLRRRAHRKCSTRRTRRRIEARTLGFRARRGRPGRIGFLPMGGKRSRIMLALQAPAREARPSRSTSCRSRPAPPSARSRSTPDGCTHLSRPVSAPARPAPCWTTRTKSLARFQRGGLRPVRLVPDHLSGERDRARAPDQLPRKRRAARSR